MSTTVGGPSVASSATSTAAGCGTVTDLDQLATVDIERRYGGAGFTVLTEEMLAESGLGAAQIAAAARAGRLLRLAPGVVLLPATVASALEVLGSLAQPFTAAQARDALGTSRKVMVPLLEYLAAQGRTRRDAEGNHRVTGR
jgi:selenocysteine-specific elongation factor